MSVASDQLLHKILGGVFWKTMGYYSTWFFQIFTEKCTIFLIHFSRSIDLCGCVVTNYYIKDE